MTEFDQICLNVSMSFVFYLKIMKLVNQNVAMNFKSNTREQPSTHNKKQMSTFTSQLTKSLIFTKTTVAEK